MRVDGTHQIDETIMNPSFPELGQGNGTVLPPSLIRLGPDLSQPTIHQASIGYERPLKTFGQFRTDYMMTRATDTFRSINVNAPFLRRAPGSDSGQHHADRVHRPPRLRPDHRGGEPARAQSPDHGQRHVSVDEQRAAMPTRR